VTQICAPFGQCPTNGYEQTFIIALAEMRLRANALIKAYPKETVFGKAPAPDDKLVEAFLKDKRFLLASPNAYNSLGVGTTQLYDGPRLRKAIRDYGSAPTRRFFSQLLQTPKLTHVALLRMR
jgi:hypothetical protein